MKAVTGILNDLVRKRLWPVALLLIAAAVAAPMVLARTDNEAPSPGAGSAAAKAEQGEGDPIVALAGDDYTEGRRRVLGSRKDPFRPTGPRARTAEDGAGTTSSGSTTESTGGGGGGDAGGGGGDTGGGTPDSGSGQTPSSGTGGKRFEVFSLTVRFGESAVGQLARRTIPRLTALPDAASPVIIYLGLNSDEKTAIFLVEAGVTVQGDGVCKPRPADCQTLHLKAGETAFLDATTPEGAKQYQLDLVKIHKRTTASVKAARKANGRSSAAGRKALRARVTRVRDLRFNPRTGKLKRLTKHGYKAALARASAR